jgi:transcriptional regulator with XRE-family HTH domain
MMQPLIDVELEKLGDLIKETRKSKGLTQQQLAKTCQVSRVLIYELENGRAKNIGYSNLLTVLDVLNLHLTVEANEPIDPYVEDLFKI